MMVHVRLETSDGKLVSNEAVPQFNEPPKSIVWGSRSFTYHTDERDDDGLCCWVYRECLSYYITGQEKQLYGQMFEMAGKKRPEWAKAD